MDIEREWNGNGQSVERAISWKFCLTHTVHMCIKCLHCLLPLFPLFFQGLRKKTVAPGAVGLDDHLRGSGSTDLFGSADAIVKHVLEVRGGREVGGTVHVQCIYVHVRGISCGACVHVHVCALYMCAYCM